MFRRFSANFAVLSIYVDALLIFLALYISVQLRFPLNALGFVREMKEPARLPVGLYVLFPILWTSVLLVFSVYDGRKNLKASDEFVSLTLGSALATISMAGILYLSYRETSRFLFLMFVVLAFGFLVAWRVIFRFCYRRYLGGAIEARRVLVLGAGSMGYKMCEQITKHQRFGLNFVGFLDDDPQKQARDPKVLGSLGAVRDVINDFKIDDVVIALPRSAYVRLNQVVSELHDLPVRVWVVLDYLSLALHRAAVDDFAGLPMLDLRAPALSEYQRMLKRAFDLVVTLLSLIIALPLMGIIAFLIKLDSPGPILYRAKRMGENGKIFEMLKFRTMIENADEFRELVMQVRDDGSVLYKKPDDPRVTRIGKILRKTSLDELPQLFNVLKGEMSLVGPRPEQPHLVEKYELWQRKRFAVPQGITGWWQIHGRSDKPMHLHTEEDLYYIQHYSIWLDIQILINTIWAVLRGRGAY